MDSTSFQTDTVYEINKNEAIHICVACECPPGNHLSFWKCPLFEGEYICVECCQVDALQPEAAAKFSEKFGCKLTFEEINKICQACGHNYALQDPSLIPESINNRNKLDI